MLPRCARPFSYFQQATKTKICEVIHFASSEARNRTMLARSSGCSRPFRHWTASICFSPSGVTQSFFWRSVMTQPGETVFARMLNGPRSRESARQAVDGSLAGRIGGPATPRRHPGNRTQGDGPSPAPAVPLGDDGVRGTRIGAEVQRNVIV